MKKRIISIHLLICILLVGMILNAASHPHKNPAKETVKHKTLENQIIKSNQNIPSDFDGLTPHILLF